MLFPKIDADTLVQIADMFRIDVSKSFVTNGEELTEINIWPDFVGAPLVSFNVLDPDQDSWYLDWAYETDGDYTVRLELKTDTDSKVTTHTVTAVTAEDDHLLSDDNMIYTEESEFKKYLPYGRNSWKYIHRKALGEILDYLYRKGKLNPDGTKITKEQLIGDNLAEWSTYEAILLILQDNKTSDSEAWTQKIQHYKEKREDYRDRYLIIYDSDKDGEITEEDIPKGLAPKFFSR